MRMNFKRTFSGLLAFILMLSSLVVVNTASVSAADGDRVFDLGSEKVRNGFTFTDETNKTVLANGTGNGKKSSYTFTDPEISDFEVKFTSNRSAIADDISNDNMGYIEVNSDTISFHASNDNAELTIRASTKSQSRTFTITGANGGQATVVSPDGGIIEQDSNYAKITVLKYTLDKTDTYTIKASSDKVRIYDVTVNDKGAGEAANATWTVVATGTPIDGKVKLEPLTNSTSAVLRYTDSDNKYSVIPSKRIIKVGDNNVSGDGNSYTLTLTNDNWTDYFTENLNIPVENIVISGEHAANRVLHLECSTHGTVYSIKLDETGKAKGMLVEDTEGETPGGYKVEEMLTIPLHSGNLIATMAGGTLDGADSQTVNITSTAGTIKYTYLPYTVAPVSDTDTGKIKFDQLKISSITRAERLLGGTILDKTTNHFFVVANKDTVSNTVFALSDPVKLGTDATMKAVVIRRDTGDSSAGAPKEGEGIGFTLGQAKEGKTFKLHIFCTAVRDVKDKSDDNTSIGLKEIDPATYADKGGSSESDIVDIKETDQIDEGDWQEVEFSHLKSDSSYVIYNPKGDSQGNLRIFAIQIEQVDEKANEGLVWTPDNETDILGSAINSIAATTLNKNNASNFKTDIFNNGTGSVNGQNYVELATSTDILPSDSGTLLLYLTAGQEGIKPSASINEVNGSAVYSGNFYGTVGSKDMEPISITVEKGKKYRVGNKALLFRAELTPSGSAVAAISGKVEEIGKYEIVDHVNKSEIYNNKEKKVTNAEGSTEITTGYDSNSSKTDNAKDVQKDIEGAEIKIKNTADSTEYTAKSQANGTYTFNNDGNGVPEGTYTVTATKDGKAIGKAQTIKVEGGKVSGTADFTVDNTVTVTFRTDIKDFKFDIIVKDSAGKDVIHLNDTTYHYFDTSKGDVARIESITHTVRMPAGTYSFAKASDNNNNDARFELKESDRTTAVKELTIDASKPASKTIYLAPADAKINTIKEQATTKAAEIGETVTKGTYKFLNNGGTADSVAKATITYSVNMDGSEPNPEYNEKGIYAEGHAPASGERLGISNLHDKSPGDKTQVGGGYVVFKINTGDSFVTKIKTSNQACALIVLDEKGKINGSSKIISTDSRFDTMTVTLTEGTYLLMTTADGTANVESITFDVASPFEVTAFNDVTGEGLENAKIIVGTFDTSQITEDNYTSFAILVSKDVNALKWAALNGTAGGGAPNENNPSGEEVKSSDPTSDNKSHTATVKDLDVKTSAQGAPIKVFRDETEEVFETILDAKGDILVKEEANKYFYAIIANNFDTADGTYYAVGAARTQKDGSWMVQGTPFELN